MTRWYDESFKRSVRDYGDGTVGIVHRSRWRRVWKWFLHREGRIERGFATNKATAAEECDRRRRSLEAVGRADMKLPRPAVLLGTVIRVPDINDDGSSVYAFNAGDGPGERAMLVMLGEDG